MRLLDRLHRLHKIVFARKSTICFVAFGKIVLDGQEPASVRFCLVASHLVLFGAKTAPMI
jgi:hypothetical protein